MSNTTEIKELKEQIENISGRLIELTQNSMPSLNTRMDTMHERQNRQEAYIAQALTEIKDSKNEINEHMNKIANQHEERVRECLAKMSKRFDDKIDSTMASAFPDGDPHGHRMYHEAEIEWMKNRNQFFKELFTHLAKASILGGLALIFVALWNWLMMEIKR